MKESILSQLLIKCPFPEVFEDISNCAILTTQQHISHVNTITGIEVLCVKPSKSPLIDIVPISTRFLYCCCGLYCKNIRVKLQGAKMW